MTTREAGQPARRPLRPPSPAGRRRPARPACRAGRRCCARRTVAVSPSPDGRRGDRLVLPRRVAEAVAEPVGRLGAGRQVGAVADVEPLGVLEPPVGGRDLAAPGRRPSPSARSWAAGRRARPRPAGRRPARCRTPCPGTRTPGRRTTSSRHGSSTGEPALTTTTVRGLAAATARTSSSCRPGSASDVRSKPSLSTSSLVPTTTTATSLVRASSTAWASSSSAGRVGGPTTSPTRKMKPSAGQRYRMRTSTRRPAASGTVVVLRRRREHLVDVEDLGLLGLLEHGRAVQEHAAAQPGHADAPVAVLVRHEAGVHLELRGPVGHGRRAAG